MAPCQILSLRPTIYDLCALLGIYGFPCFVKFSSFKQVISGDDDLPKRDDIGERRRKHELRVLAGAGIKSADDVEDESADLSSDGVDEVDANGETDSDLEFYKQVEKKHSAKVAAKEEMYSRFVTSVFSLRYGIRLAFKMLSKS